jgi:glucose-6-phosphate isomerase, archaeal
MTPEINLDILTGELMGSRVQDSLRTIQDMNGYYRDECARESLNPQTPVYRVQAFQPVPEGTEGGLFFGTTFIYSGLVGDEYFMTKGHFHLNRTRSEYYVTVTGVGALILMDESRRTTVEPMQPGSVHYIQPNTAHRVANVGDSILAFFACWPSDSGHDYGSIASEGFGARLRKVNGVATLVEES